MINHSSAKPDDATVPQSPIVRHLGLIKAVTVIMAILIVVALAVVMTTIYGRLTNTGSSSDPTSSIITIPEGARIISASLNAKGEILLVVERPDDQQLWYLDIAGRKERVIDIRIAK